MILAGLVRSVKNLTWASRRQDSYQFLLVSILDDLERSESKILHGHLGKILVTSFELILADLERSVKNLTWASR